MSTIQIKRGTGSAVPSGLADGELAINLDSRQLYFGSSSVSVSDFKINNLTVNELTSSIVTSSIIFSSGSNIFGDASSDTHTFNGNITASDNISSSLAGTVSAGSGSYHILHGDTSQPTGLEVSGYGSFTNITGSGNISSSGVLLMGKPGVNVTHTFFGRIKTVGSEVFIGDGHISASGNITASGNISSSGEVRALTGSFGTGTTTVTDKIFTTGEISASKIDAPRVETDLIEVKSGGKLKIKGSDITMENGHISMSGDIVMTGSISGSIGSTASFAHIITQGDTIEFKDGGTKLGSIKFDSGKGFQVKDSNNNSGKLDAKELIVANSISSSGGFEVKNGRVTASFISSSTEIITPTLKGGGNTTGLIVAGFTNVQGSITSSGDISSSGTLLMGTPGVNTTHLFYGRIKTIGSEVFIGDGHISASGNITASGNISSSGTVQALTGSFGTGTTTVTDKIFTTGEISGSALKSSGDIESTSGTVRVRNVIATGRIQGKGSDVVIENGHISMSGDIIMTGSLSSSAQVRALTGSFGTGTTTITDEIHTTGIVSGSTIKASGDIESTTGTLKIKDIVGTGKLRMKGSDVTIENGHISMSGNMIMTGSITAGGNVSAGSNGTGSFDHIITLDDTIEFRNKSNRSEVKGFMKFDPEKGLIHLSGSNKVNTNSTINIKPTDFYPIGLAVGGKGAGGIATLQPRNGNSSVRASAAGVFTCEKIIPKGLTPGNVVIFGSDTTNTYQVYVGTLANNNTATNVTPGAGKNPTVAVGSLCNPSSTFSGKGITWNSNNHYLIIYVTTNGTDEIYGGAVAIS